MGKEQPTPPRRKRNDAMEAHAIMLKVRMSVQKVREVLRQIRGLNALPAQASLVVGPR